MLKTIWINAGEASGDLHGALFIEALKKRLPHVQCMGMGGEAMRQSGLEALYRVEDLSVMGFTEVISRLPTILTMLKNMKKDLVRLHPDALVVIDAPSFNFRIIKTAHDLGIPVYYYISPKVWASRPGRVKFIKRYVKRVISILPFEVPFYEKFGVDVDYVGNPLVDAVNYEALQHITPEEGLIGIMPGSRKKEITSLLPAFSQTAKILQQKLPCLRFKIVRAPNLTERFIRQFWVSDVPLEFEKTENRWEFMRRCQMLIAASGTVTLESALAGTPTLVTYKLSPLTFMLAKHFVKVPFISLPNLIANKQIFPELLQADCDAENLARYALQWLHPANGTNPLADVRKELDKLRLLLGEKGAPNRAVQCVLQDFLEK